MRRPAAMRTAVVTFTALLTGPFAQADGFPGLARVLPGFGPYGFDKGYDEQFRLYGTLDVFASYHDSDHHAGYMLEGGGAWTNKVGLYYRTPVAPDTVLEMDAEEGLNLNGQAFDQHWKDISAPRLAVVALRSKAYGRLEAGKTYGTGTPTTVDPFFAVYGSPYTYLASAPYGKGSYYSDARPKHTLAYTTPAWLGLTLRTALQFGFNDAADAGKTVRGKGVMLTHTTTRSLFMMSYNDVLSDPWDDQGVSRQTHNYFKSTTLFYDFGPVSADLNWQRQTVDYPTTPTMTAITLGMVAPVGKADVARLVWVHRHLSADEQDATGAMLGYDHFINRHWAIYGRLGAIKNQPRAYVSYAGIPLEQGGDDPQNLAIGTYYHF